MIKNKNTIKPFYMAKNGLFVAIFFAFFIFFFASPKVIAATADFARWYSSNEQLSEGQIVSVKTDQGEYVESAVVGTATKLLGVIVPENEALISVNGSEGVQVAVAGRAQAKVNLSNGPIARGDLVGLSNISGVGAKALAGQPVVGIAEASFGDEEEGQSTREELLPVIISVGVAPSSVFDNTSNSASWLRSIAGNNVTALQLAFVLFIAAIGLTSIIVLTYSSIRSGVVAVGRNPLAKPAILSALSQAMIMVAVIAISSFSLMYFILRL